MRSVYSSKDVTPKNLLSHVFNYLKNEIFRTSEFLYLWLPAYNYSAFTTKCADQSINTTDFGLAHLILTNTEEKLFDVFFDPVFSYIIYPGSGKRLNLNSDIYSPFSNNHPANLGSEDWLVFTKNAFQPSHLMNIEQRFFGDSHPYRYKKTFDIELINPSKLTKLEYWVRPRDSKFVEYRLKSLQNELLNEFILNRDSHQFISFCNYESLYTWSKNKLRRDSLSLLTSKSRHEINQIKNDRQMIDPYFYE